MGERVNGRPAAGLLHPYRLPNPPGRRCLEPCLAAAHQPVAAPLPLPSPAHNRTSPHTPTAPLSCRCMTSCPAPASATWCACWTSGRATSDAVMPAVTSPAAPLPLPAIRWRARPRARRSAPSQPAARGAGPAACALGSAFHSLAARTRRAHHAVGCPARARLSFWPPLGPRATATRLRLCRNEFASSPAHPPTRLYLRNAAAGEARTPRRGARHTRSGRGPLPLLRVTPH